MPKPQQLFEVISLLENLLKNNNNFNTIAVNKYSTSTTNFYTLIRRWEDNYSIQISQDDNRQPSGPPSASQQYSNQLPTEDRCPFSAQSTHLKVSHNGFQTIQSSESQRRTKRSIYFLSHMYVRLFLSLWREQEKLLNLLTPQFSQCREKNGKYLVALERSLTLSHRAAQWVRSTPNW